ncbi:MAG: Ig-like domain-containing protein, partial [Candidatus Woesearchaeota archaeon]
MKKIILFLFVLLFALAAVHSDMLQTNTAFKAVLSVDAQNQFTNQPVTGFQARGYICGDHSCSFVTDALWSNQPKHTHTHQLVLDYPTNPPLYGDFSYGVFYYKEGYVPYEVTLAPQGSGHGMTTVYLSKIDMCRSPIDTFSVTNTVYPNQPVMVDIVTALDSKAHAAIKNAGPIEYIPDELQSHYSVQTKIILDILDSTGAVVDQQEKVVSIPYSEYEHIQFEWIPEQVGAYSARVRTQVPDAKCLDYQEHSSSKQFSVINEGSTNMCYALAQDLYASPVEPEVGQTVTAYVDALANFYNEFGELKTTPFSVEFTVKKDGAVVHSEVKNIAQHSQDDQFIRTQTSFIPTQKGYYSISARAVVDTCPYDANLDDTVSQTIYVKGEKTVDPDPDPNAPPIVSALPKKTLLNNQSQYPNAIILDNYVFDPDGDELTYTITSQTNSQLVDCTLADTQLGKVDCHLPNILSQQWFLMPPEYEQTFENFLNKHAVSFEEGDEKWYYIHGKKDPQVWFYSFKKDEWIDIAYDVFFKGAWIYKKNTSIYHLQSGTLALSSVTTGSSTVGFEVTDGTDAVSFTWDIDVLDANRPPVFEDISDIFLRGDITHHANILNLNNYASDPDGDALTFGIAHQSNRDLVECSLFGSYLSCEVKENKDGQSQVVFTASDGSKAATQTVTIFVEQVDVNRPPVFSSIPGRVLYNNHSLYENIIRISDFVTDPDGDELKITLESQSRNDLVSCSLDSQTRLSCSVSQGKTGVTILYFRATDGKLSATASMRIHLEQGYVPFTFDPIEDFTLDGSVAEHRIISDILSYVSDRDRRYEFSLTQSNTDLVDCEQFGGRFTCFVQKDEDGQSQLSISIDDGTTKLERTFTVFVQKSYTPFHFSKLNDATLAGNIERHVVYNDLRDFIEFGSKETVSFSVVLQSNSNLVHCFIEQFSLVCDVNRNEDGSSTLSIRADDGKTQQTQSMTVFVEKVIENRPPVTNYPDINIKVGDKRVVYDLKNFAVDPDSDPLTFSVADGDTSIATCRVASSSHLLCEGVSVGQTQITITTSDGIHTVEDLVTVTVSEKPQDYVPFTFNKLNDATLAGNIERHVVYNDLRDFIE